MKKVFASLFLSASLALSSVGVVAGAPHAHVINVIPEVVTYTYVAYPGDSIPVEVPVEWSANRFRGNGGLWGNMRCYDERSLVLEEYENLADPEADSFIVDITPSWDGSTPLSCDVTSYEVINGAFRQTKAFDQFSVVIAN